MANLIEVRGKYFRCTPLVYGVSYFTVKVHQLGQAWSCKYMLMTSDHLLDFNIVGNSSRKLCHFPRTKVRLDSLWSPRLFSFALLKIGLPFAYAQSSGTFPACDNLSEIIKSGFATALASLIRAERCIWSGLMDLCLFRLFKCSPTPSSSTCTGCLRLQKVLPGFQKEHSTIASPGKC